MQRIEADAVGAEMIGEFDQAGEIGKVTHAPVARGADAVKLDRKQPATVELAAKRPFRRRDQRHVLGGRGVAYLEAVDARRQVLGPVDGVIRALALGDKPRVRNDFPRHRKPGQPGARFATAGPERTTTGWPTSGPGACGGSASRMILSAAASVTRR